MSSLRVAPGAVVVGVDDSESAARAVDWALEQARLEQRRLVLVACTRPRGLPAATWWARAGVDGPSLDTALRGAAEQLLDDLRTRTARRPRVEVEACVVEDDPRAALVELAEGAHMVVVGSRGRGAVASTFLGSVSAHVARHASCPVVVCRPSTHRSAGSEQSTPRRVLVGADGGPASGPVLEFAFTQASLRGALLEVVHVFYDARAAVAGFGVLPADSAEQDYEDERALLAASVAGLREKHPDVEVVEQLSRGLVDECLTDRAPAADLLVVGRRRESGLDGLLHASCAMAVLERATTTVAVVPEPG